MVLRYCLVLYILLVSNAYATSKSTIPFGLSDLECMTLNLYYESRGEVNSLHIAAIGYVTVQRVINKYYPDTVCKVVYEQRYSKKYKRWVPMYSWTLDSNSDIPKNTKSYNKCLNIAKKILNRDIIDVTNNATHYHNLTVKPYWASSMIKTASLGNHIFYR